MADREAHCVMHIETVIKTVPYLILAGRINYAHYTPAYIAEIKQLGQTQPRMYEHMVQGGFVVRRSPHMTFNCVTTD